MSNPIMPLGVTAVMLPELDFQQQIDACVAASVTHYSIRPRQIAPAQRPEPYSMWGNHKFDLTPARLVQEGAAIARQLADAGLTPWGTVPAATCQASDDELKEHFEGAAAAGAGRVRVNPPNTPVALFDYDRLLDQTVTDYQRATALARPFRLKLVMETHCGNLASSPALARNICQHFDPARLGVIFDLANFNGEGALEPHLAVAVIKDYIDHVHIGGMRQTTGDYDAQGFRRPGRMMSPLTEANLYLPAWIDALTAAGVHVPLIIEDFTTHPPSPLRLQLAADALRRVFDARP